MQIESPFDFLLKIKKKQKINIIIFFCFGIYLRREKNVQKALSYYSQEILVGLLFIKFILYTIYNYKPFCFTEFCRNELRSGGYVTDDQALFSSAGPTSGESMINGHAWTPNTIDPYPFVTVVFPDTAIVSAILIQGGSGSFMKQFKVRVQNIHNTWETIADGEGNAMVNYVNVNLNLFWSIFVLLHLMISLFPVRNCNISAKSQYD